MGVRERRTSTDYFFDSNDDLINILGDFNNRIFAFL